VDNRFMVELRFKEVHDFDLCLQVRALRPLRTSVLFFLISDLEINTKSNTFVFQNVTNEYGRQEHPVFEELKKSFPGRIGNGT